MMMNLCVLSLLIEDVVAIGGARGRAADILTGKGADTNESETPEVVPETAPETPEEVPEVPAPSEENSDAMVSCGGHDADSCGACITAPGAPEGKEAASWCNGDCYVAFSGDVASCLPIENGFVSCGHHQAEECSSCTNEAVGGALFCNGVCEFNAKTNKCADS